MQCQNTIDNHSVRSLILSESRLERHLLCVSSIPWQHFGTAVKGIEAGVKYIQRCGSQGLSTYRLNQPSSRPAQCHSHCSRRSRQSWTGWRSTGSLCQRGFQNGLRLLCLSSRDGTVRICSDYKLTVNKAVKFEVYPLPCIEDLLCL